MIIVLKSIFSFPSSSCVNFSCQVLVTTPDLITIVDSAMGTAITTEYVRYGLRVAVIAFASAPQLRTEAALKFVGPRAFKYDLDFNPIGEYSFCDPIPTLP